jgi:hypothetical protein
MFKGICLDLNGSLQKIVRHVRLTKLLHELQDVPRCFFAKDAKFLLYPKSIRSSTPWIRATMTAK